ncbi:hypothetical protein FRUB_07070 [Fimbriiglobus ruber]|uniref:Uncharacterized protein n=1 Tax=Fimbriiglobus ruber TaxID=1908690 RepID=A0A225D8L8_9BACT|nr:hypothetical protein FRUB_07070 [Fimbriiglobus ruber]
MHLDRLLHRDRLRGCGRWDGNLGKRGGSGGGEDRNQG